MKETDKKILLEIAREAITNKLLHSQETPVPDSALNVNSQPVSGVFVSLHHPEGLRGCVGRFESDLPLVELVQKMAVAAAFGDSRFADLSLEELYDIKIEISLLSPLKQIASPEEISIGKHGIYIKQGTKKGTLLPQVALKNNWDALEFVRYCSKHKAGLGLNGWKMAEIYTYTADVFSE